ncbi:MAG: 2-haloalkanoic acid dehalogenase [uncultured Thermomicrobiales bacterium]|uniref:2-haloalkanoic acid dehalogenase n=1 Tax=uncultured Thermomicrobiales bacterium TaxID=1645740 RepID=A0A6J4V5B2_9BACT|nr:MAG: 2-haloalkanoic acid dehalogenase [uncultured Thermomicrobiales bacterium]
MLDFGRFTHLTFDCYGTLIDWEAGILAALQPVLTGHGLSLPDEQVLELFGELEAAAEAGPYQPYSAVLTAVLAGFGQHLGFTLADDEREALARSVPDWPPFPDTVEALGALAKHCKLVILSNIDDDLFAGSARHLRTDFAEVITAQQVGSYKPNVGNFRHALQKLAIPSEQILHVAQSLFHDIAPAKEVGLTTVWVNRRHDRPGFGATPPARVQPDLEVPDLRSLAALVERQLVAR